MFDSYFNWIPPFFSVCPGNICCLMSWYIFFIYKLCVCVYIYINIKCMHLYMWEHFWMLGLILMWFIQLETRVRQTTVRFIFGKKSLNGSCSFCFGYECSALYIWKYMLHFLCLCLRLSPSLPVSQTLSIWVTASAGSAPAMETCFLSFLSTADRLSVTYWEYKDFDKNVVFVSQSLWIELLWL